MAAPPPTHAFSIQGLYCDASDAAAAASAGAAAAVAAGAPPPRAPTAPAVPFPLPTFATADECRTWVSAHKRCTNPTYPACTQLVTHACDWAQVREFLLAPLAALRAREPLTTPPPRVPATNRFANDARMLGALRSRLDLPFHASTSEESTLNTLRYLFFHMRCGIFVAIRGGRLRMFVPFVNKDYVNTWGDALAREEPGSLADYVAAKRDMLLDMAKGGLAEKEAAIEPDARKWWANGNIICNVSSPGFWGDSYLAQLQHMLTALCESRTVADCEFFINKRDFPQLKRNLSEPYDFVFAADDAPLSREGYASLAPIASFFCGELFADLPLVCTDDWETATGLVYPPAGTDLRSARNRAANAVPWSERVATAFFRGTSTGAGTTPETNQRLALAKLSASWAKPGSGFSAEDERSGGAAFLDAGVVGFNFRDRKIQGAPMTFIKPQDLGIATLPRVPQYKQGRYKYAIYVDGHCAAMRYASMMPLGSVILKVAPSTKADSLWYYPLLVPHDWHADGGNAPVSTGDHLPVSSDLSDLGDVIAWAKAHDSQCEAIARNAQALFDRLISVDGQLDYLQIMCAEISARFTPHGSAGAAAAAAPRARVPLLAPRLCRSPFIGGDWFGAASPDYTCLSLGGGDGTNASGPDPPPMLREFATSSCECPACEDKRRAITELHEANAAAEAAAADAARAAAAGRAAAAAQRAAKADAAAAAARASGGGAGAGAGGGKASAPPPAAGPRFADIAKAKAAAAKAAEAARKRARPNET